ncbi:sulfurtransferase-like selenium metabolism protein YedF [Enterococcus sp. CSURQ0835]|uniref:sulfurtransferase-like selenium metabolism protein YedF n=1 Tax=Enterococcus sp. CSURQ0835 TaxID=2681394 RepID=UPI001358885F|nr:sulfurtransferase-like selenium metabolism protein YedF [Enterococcus sp. CSURQ0835]
MYKINALGQACPLPVIETKKALRENDAVETVVDNEIATQNLKKMAEQLGLMYQMNKDSDTHFTVVISKSTVPMEKIVKEEHHHDKSTTDYIVVIDTDVMGHGSDELGKNLLKTFIYSLTEQDVLPQKVIFYNGGAPLVAEGSDALEDLQTLADHDVEIYACGACLNYFELTDKVKVGEVTNMYRIVEMMRQAPRIVRP